MDDLTPLLFILPIVALLLSAGVPLRYASAAPDGWAAWIRWATTALLAASLAAVPLLELNGRPLLQVQLGQASFDLFYWNGVAAVMLALVSFVGWIVVRNSMRQLDAGPDAAAYHRNFAATLGGISLAVVAGNLLLMFAGWLLANAGVRRLLSHDRQHPGAMEGARMKLAVDRLGAFLLAGALIVIYQQHGTWNLAQLFQPLLDQPSAAAAAELPHVIAGLLVLAAAVISVQFPFGFWLPETLATPTPVSALMHAGIINAGGYFLIRLNPLLAPAPAALTILAAIGAVTLLLGGLAMLTQTSVKRTLAFSTIAQMGFMMLQCGMGAWTAAMLHIVAHSLYKAYAFLASGDVITVARAVDPVQEPPRGPGLHAAFRFGAATGIVVACYLGVMVASGLSPADKPGGYLLGAMLCLALIRRTWSLLEDDVVRMAALSTVTTVGLCIAYVIAYRTIDVVVGGNELILAFSPLRLFVSLGIGCSVLALLGWELLLRRRPAGPLTTRVYVHAVNGFYADVMARRVLRSLAT